MTTEYKDEAYVVRIVDGDTIRVDLDLGFGVWLRNQAVRLYGIDTPEIRGAEREAGLEAKDWLRGQIENKRVLLETFRGEESDKYGRWLARVWHGGDDINELLVSTGHARSVI